MMRAQAMVSRSYSSAFPLALAAKDAHLAADAGAAAGLRVPVLAAVAGLFDTADAEGHGHADMAAVFETSSSTAPRDGADVVRRADDSTPVPSGA
jgi:3-hydroxyisobutyrate dehydrogenase-like beta-hydroxyacid dehydrogenase